MARTVPPRVPGPDPTYINLCRLLYRLEEKLLSPDNAPALAHSSFERSKTGTNLEYARSLLLRLEHDSSSIKIQSQKQSLQADLQAKRDQIKRLNQRLRELNDLAVDSDEEDEEEEEDNAVQTRSDKGVTESAATNGGPTTAETRHTSTQRPEPTTSATLRSRHAPTTSAPATTTGSSLFPPNLNSPPTNVDIDPNLSQTEALLSHNRHQQENLTESLLDLARQLKTSAIDLGTGFASEKDVLARAAAGLDKNTLGMETAGRRMGTLRRMTEGKGWLARLKIYGLIALLWVVALVIVFILPKLRF